MIDSFVFVLNFNQTGDKEVETQEALISMEVTLKKNSCIYAKILQLQPGVDERHDQTRQHC
jgi:hypothetical protein